MKDNYIILQNLLLGIEFLAALIAFFYFFKLKNTYWKWFSIYLIIIFIQECFWFFNDSGFGITKQKYYALIGIPIQYLFWYWLFALKSLKLKKLFYTCVVLYLLTYIPIELYFKELEIVYSLNLTVGTILLGMLITLEFKKQIKTDNILKFRENKMFYITIGIILFYIGTYPFFAFYKELKGQYIEIWNIYYLYFRISICIMYLLFLASFIWGKYHSK